MAEFQTVDVSCLVDPHSSSPNSEPVYDHTDNIWGRLYPLHNAFPKVSFCTTNALCA